MYAAAPATVEPAKKPKILFTPPLASERSSPSENVASVVCRGGERLTRSGRHPRASEQGAVRQCRSRPCSKSGSHAHQARGRPGLFWHSSCSVSIRVWGYIPRSDAYPAFASWGSGGPLQREEEGEKRQEGGGGVWDGRPLYEASLSVDFALANARCGCWCDCGCFAPSLAVLRRWPVPRSHWPGTSPWPPWISPRKISAALTTPPPFFSQETTAPDNTPCSIFPAPHFNVPVPGLHLNRLIQVSMW